MTRAAAIAAVAAIVTVAAVPAHVEAQSWRIVELARQVRDTAEHRVRIAYALGRLEVFAGDAPLLYEARIRYDETRASPRTDYDADTRQLDIAVDVRDESGSGKTGPGEMRLTLTRHVPLALELVVGAGGAEIDLGGLALRELSVEANASDANVTFDVPNRTAMRMLDMHARAASLRATRLANAGAAQMRFGAGVGNLELDFGGRWTQDIEASVDVAVGRVRVRVPESVGVRVEISRVLARFEHPDLERQGDAWVSSNWASAPHHLTLRIDTAFGAIEIERFED